jgi:hypothetical protein
MNGIMRLMWTYLNRIRELSSTVTSRLDVTLKHFFPTGRMTVFPHDDHLEPLIYIVHFIVIRHFDYGRDLCLELLQEGPIKAAHGSSICHLLAAERMTIAIQAILLSLHLIEKDEQTPAWPSNPDFSVLPVCEDYPTSSDIPPQSLMAKPGMHDILERFSSALASIAMSCASTVGNMSVFDEQWSTSKLPPAYEEAHNYVIRRHPEGSFAYSNALMPQISVLQACFQAWPRCLHPTLSLCDAIDLLVRGIIHVEPALSDVASGALRRFMADPQHALTVLSRYTNFLFNAGHIAIEGSGTKLVLEHTRLLGLWVNLVDAWIQDHIQNPPVSISDEGKKAIASRVDEIEAGALFMLSHDSWPIRSAGVSVFRKVWLLMRQVFPDGPDLADPARRDLRIVDLLHGKGVAATYLEGYDELLDHAELERIEQWRRSERPDIPLRIANGNNERDCRLWRYTFPAFMRCCLEHAAQVIGVFREVLVAAATRFHPSIALIAGLSTRVPAGLAPRNPHEKDGSRFLRDNRPLVDQWHLWLKVLCATAVQSESSRPVLTQLGRDHSRAPSDANFDRERMTTTRGLFRYLTPFLDSEYATFRDVAVVCISSLPSSAYPQLLEDLSLLTARQFYDEARSKLGTPLSSARMRRQERLYSAVARIYYLTAPFLQHQRSTGRQAAFGHVFKFVRSTQTYLSSSETCDNHALQRLRKYFCGTVERLFDGVATLKDSDRFVPQNMHLSLYRLCQDWCQIGAQSETVRQRLILMQRASSSHTLPSPNSTERFQQEAASLSDAAVGALASLCVSPGRIAYALHNNSRESRKRRASHRKYPPVLRSDTAQNL